MKILFITSRADLGGGPEHLLQLLLNLPPKAEAHVACPDDAPYRARFEAIVGSDRIHIIPHRAFAASALTALIRLVRAEKVDAIHSHGKGAGLYGRILACLTRARSVHTFHGLHVGEYGAVKRQLYYTLETAMGWATSRAICVSEGEASLIEKAGFISREKLTVIPNGVAMPDQKPGCKDGEKLRILAVNRYDHQKNPEMLIRIAAGLAGKRDFELTVIGTGERIGEIRRQAAELGLEGTVHIAGGVAAPREFMRRNSVFLSTSRWEGMPLAVLEAMSEGLCVVATDVVGNNDVVSHNETGLLYTTETEAVQVLEHLSLDRINIIGRKAHTLVRNRYSAARMAEATFRTLAEVSETSNLPR